MTIAVLADDVLKKELLSKPVAPGIDLVWADSVRSLAIIDADVFMDLLFEYNPERTATLKQLQSKPVFLNAVTYSTKTIGGGFIRINAWPTLLQRNISEVAIESEEQQQTVQRVFDKLQWQYKIVPDVPGMITARVLAMIINEAYYTLEADVSTREEIDTAMKLGTNYPLGPFEWSETIGLLRVYELLKELSRTDSRYTPAPLMEKEVMTK